MKNPEMGGYTPEQEKNHTRWAKDRALEHLKQGALKQAIDSIVSDLSKDRNRPDEQKMLIGMMGLSLRNDPELNEQKVRDFIEGFAE